MKRLGDIIVDLKQNGVYGNKDIQVRGISYDSRDVQSDYLLCCIKGLKRNGHNYVEEAYRRGARSFIVERSIEKKEDTTVVTVPDAREALALVSRRFYDDPSKKLKIVGITGTDGKTTTSWLVRNIIRKKKQKVGLIGSVGYYIGNRRIEGERTTPESSDIFSMLKEMSKRGIKYGVMEVTSHGIALKRTFGIDYRVAVFTNISRNHLDFHKSSDNYISTKVHFFDNLNKDAISVINVDDSVGAQIAHRVRGRVITYGLKKVCDVSAYYRFNGYKGTLLNIVYRGRDFVTYFPFPGLYNVYNALASFSVGVALNFTPQLICSALKKRFLIPGRFEIIQTEPFTVVVDYAHTPDALRAVLTAARELAEGRVISVFGCGGERDKGKRPIMGSVASELSDIVVVTSDNPRGEQPELIIERIKNGIKYQNYKVIPDRREAIRFAISEAKPKDFVVVAGRGAEKYQIVGKEKIPLDDREVILDLL